MYQVGRALKDDGTREASVVPLDRVWRSIHLYPRFGSTVPREWTSTNVLELCQDYYVNPFTDRHVYGTVV